VLHILICGIENLLGSSCAARLLQVPNVCISYLSTAYSLEQVTDLVMRASMQIADQPGAIISRSEIRDRCCPVGVDSDLSPRGYDGPPRVDEAWYFRSAGGRPEEATVLDHLIAFLPTTGAEFNYVVFDGNLGDCRPGDMEPSAGLALEELSSSGIVRHCQSHGIKYRVLLTSLIAGAGGLTQEKTNEVFSAFLASLHSFKAEVEERAPQYFDFHALRYLAPADATINVLPAAVASDLLLRIARNSSNGDASFSIVSPRRTPFSVLCEHISAVYGLSLLPVEDPAQLNAVDRAFQQRAGQMQSYFETRPKIPDIKAYVTAGLSPEAGVFDDEAQLVQLESICRSQDAVRAERERRTADIPAALGKRTVTRDGSAVTYYAGGTAGSTVVLLNALGQGLEFWYRLIDQLIDKYRIIIWEPRGTVCAPMPFGLADQVNDLETILQNEAVQSCHLVGWCTSPKVIVEFYFRRPKEVLSMVFLNSTFKCDGSPEELDTPYEKNLEFLCRRLVLKPAMAASIMNAFQSRAEENQTDSLGNVDREEVGVKVLSSASLAPKSWVLAPFRSEETTLNYARQLVDFWSNDVRSKLSNVNVPVLLLSTEYDGIVTPGSSRMAAQLLPDARHVHVPAATHYCLYDRSDFVAHLLHTFFRAPNDISAPKGAEDAVAMGL
jgi:pimeloyl-ACP methyl ester carboxylesterase